ncbi:MAG TPA: YhbY family RNA-binding protein [bacterium]|nr:YhbY family RNA-binding protein [bacterium]
MSTLNGSQRKHLRGLAHALRPVVLVGLKGFTPELARSLDTALLAHELIKVKFLDHKDEKKDIAERMAAASGAEIAGIIGNIAILYRPHPDPAKRRIALDKKTTED